MTEITPTPSEIVQDTAQEAEEFVQVGKYPVYVVHSRWSLEMLDEALKQHGDVGYLRIMYSQDHRETDRTIVIMSDDCYASLCNSGYDSFSPGNGFWVTPYTVRKYNLPGKNHNEALFVPVPPSLNHTEKTVVDEINTKIDHLVQWNIVKKNSWRIDVPLASRKTGGIKFGSFIRFYGVDLETVALVRVLMGNTQWSDEAGTEFNCFWARDRKKVKKNKKTPKENPKKAAKQESREAPKATKKKPKKKTKKNKLKAKDVPVLPQEEGPTLKQFTPSVPGAGTAPLALGVPTDPPLPSLAEPTSVPTALPPVVQPATALPPVVQSAPAMPLPVAVQPTPLPPVAVQPTALPPVVRPATALPPVVQPATALPPVVQPLTPSQ